MGFFNHEVKSKASRDELRVSKDTLHKMQCKVCPLNNAKGLCHPKLEPTGVQRPLVYVLGEVTTATEDKRGKHGVGDIGSFIRGRIPPEYAGQVRWNNIVRTHTPATRAPSFVEIEACRPSVIADIEQTKPKAIFGFGSTVLRWATGFSNASKWAGQWVPVKIGSHTCWFFPMLKPLDVLRSRRFEPSSANVYGSEIEFAFALNMRRAFQILEDLPEPVVHTEQQARSNLILLHGAEPSDLDTLESTLFSFKKVVGFDYETNRRRPYESGAKMLSVGIADTKKALSISLDHNGSQWSARQRQKIDDMLVEFFRSDVKKAVHALSFELEWTAKFFGKEHVRGSRWEDTITQAYILDARKGTLSLEHLCMMHFGINVKQLSGLDRKRLDTYPVEQVLSYNAIDARYHLLLYNELRERLSEEGMSRLYKDHLERVPTMVLTQLKGLPIDREANDEFYSSYSRQLRKLDAKIAGLKIVGRYAQQRKKPFSPTAPADLKYVLNKMLDYAVDAADEKALSDIDEVIVRLVLKHRKLTKLLSTYVLPLRSDSPVVFEDGRLHPIISTTKTDTSRTSSEEPNSQNFPKRVNKEVRKQIAGSSDELVVSFDYGQIQARNVGMESLDKVLNKSFWERHDIHADWLERVVELYPALIDGGVKTLKDKDVFRQYRNIAKNKIVFPLFFGAQAYSIARDLNCKESIASQLVDEFWDTFTGVKRWQDKKIKQYRRKGYVSSLSGFRRRAPISPNQLINAPIQADEASIVCDAMTRLSKIDDDYLQASMEIHDDLTFIWPKKKIDHLAERVIREMLYVPFEWAQCVPIVVEMSVGPNWAECKEVEAFSSDTWKGSVPDWRKKL